MIKLRKICHKNVNFDARLKNMFMLTGSSCYSEYDLQHVFLKIDDLEMSYKALT